MTSRHITRFVLIVTLLLESSVDGGKNVLIFILFFWFKVLLCFPKLCHEEMKSLRIFRSMLVLFSITLLHFGTSPVVGNKNIPFCRKAWNDLGNEMVDWRERFLDGDHKNNSQCFQAEKTHFERRRRSHGKLCFFKGRE